MCKEKYSVREKNNTDSALRTDIIVSNQNAFQSNMSMKRRKI